MGVQLTNCQNKECVNCRDYSRSWRWSWSLLACEYAKQETSHREKNNQYHMLLKIKTNKWRSLASTNSTSQENCMLPSEKKEEIYTRYHLDSDRKEQQQQQQGICVLCTCTHAHTHTHTHMRAHTHTHTPHPTRRVQCVGCCYRLWAQMPLLLYDTLSKTVSCPPAHSIGRQQVLASPRGEQALTSCCPHSLMSPLVCVPRLSATIIMCVHSSDHSYQVISHSYQGFISGFKN